MNVERKNRKVSKTLFPFLQQVFEEKGVTYTWKEQERWMEVDTALGCRQFSEYVEQAKCEKERLSCGCPDIPVVSYRTALHAEKLNAILEKFHTSCFFILSGDEGKWQRQFAQP